jgi:peroxiredoxin
MIIILLATVIVLVKQNNDLKSSVATNKLVLKEGERFNDIKAKDLSGNDSTISFNKGKKSILFVFSTKCGYCLKNVENWKNLFNSYNKKYFISGICVDSVKEIITYKEVNKIPYNILVPESKEFLTGSRINVFPVTILVNNNKVEKIWPGFLHPKTINQISEYLNQS